MLLVLHWALSNCLRPLWDSFNGFKIKITYTPHILMLTSTLEVTQKHIFHPHTKKKLHHFDMTLHHAKRYGLCKRKNIFEPRSKRKKRGKEKRKRKLAHVSKQRIESCRKGCEFHPEKIPHTCTSWSDCMACFLYWIQFVTLQYMQYKHATSSSLTLSSTKKPY